MSFAALLIGLFLVTDPTKMPVFILIAPFILIFLVVFNLWELLIMLWARAQGRQVLITLAKNQINIAAALFITLVAILQSIGQLTVHDVLTLVLLFAVGYFYARRLVVR